MKKVTITPTTAPVLHRVVLPIQTRGNIGKSTECIARSEWMNSRGVTWQGFDLDKANRTFSTTFPDATKLVELSNEPEGDLIRVFRSTRQAAVTTIDPQAHQNDVILRALNMVQFPETAAEAGIRLTALIFPIDEVSDMDDIAATVENLGSKVDWVIVRNPVRQTRTRFFDGSELENHLRYGLNAATLTLPALLSDTRNYLRAQEIRIGRGISPAEALKNPELKLEMTHRMILEHWLRDAFKGFDAIASHLLPTEEASKIASPAATNATAPVQRGRSVNLANID